MNNSLLIQGLKTLNKSEIKKFSTFIHSAYFNKNKNVQGLNDILQDYWPDFKATKYTNKTIWKALFPKAPFSELKFNNITSNLLQLFYQFLANESLQQEPFTEFHLTQKQLVNRNLIKHSLRINRKWETQLEKSAKQNGAFYLHESYRFYYLDQLSLKKKSRSFDPSLQQKSTALDHYYALQQLAVYAEMLSRENIVQSGYELPYLQDLIDRFNDPDSELSKIPAAIIFVNIIRMLQDDEPEQRFETLNQLFELHYASFESDSLRSIYYYLLNYCVKKINSGHTVYYRRIFQLYQLLINQNLLLQNGQCSQWTYANICTTAIRLGELDWTAEFITEYKKFLPAAHQENAFQYNLAALGFAKQSYSEVLQQLLSIEFQDAFYHLSAKLIQLKIYYVLKEQEAMISLVKASRKFILRNHQLSEYQQKSNQQFLKSLLLLNKLRENKAYVKQAKWEQAKAQLQQPLEDESHPVTNREWLLLQLADLA